MKVFHERVSFIYLAQNLHNPYISSPFMYSDRSLRSTLSAIASMKLHQRQLPKPSQHF
ncbi:hypothetical protein [Nostoc sp. DSM 114159]